MAIIEKLPPAQNPPSGMDWILVESDRRGFHIENCSPRNGFLSNQNSDYLDLHSAIVEAVRLADLNDVTTVFVREPELGA